MKTAHSQGLRLSILLHQKVERSRRRSQARGRGCPAEAPTNWLVLINSIFPWNLIVLQMSNTSSEMLSNASLFSAAAAHSHEFPTSQSARRSVCVSLVWFPSHQGGGPNGNTIWPGQGSAWKEKYSKLCSCCLCKARKLSFAVLYSSSDPFLSFTQEIVPVSNSAPQWAEGHTALASPDSLLWLMESPARVSN